MKRSLLVLACSASLVGCVAVNSTKLGVDTQRPAIAPADVVIYRTAAQVPGRYQEVAILNASGSTTWTSESGMALAMQKKAAALGANAIILDATSEPSAGAKVAGAIFGIDVQRKGKALAVYVLPAGDSTGTAH